MVKEKRKHISGLIGYALNAAGLLVSNICHAAAISGRTPFAQNAGRR